jgi:hypothetical protein
MALQLYSNKGVNKYKYEYEYEYKYKYKYSKLDLPALFQLLPQICGDVLNLIWSYVCDSRPIHCTFAEIKSWYVGDCSSHSYGLGWHGNQYVELISRGTLLPCSKTQTVLFERTFYQGMYLIEDHRRVQEFDCTCCIQNEFTLHIDLNGIVRVSSHFSRSALKGTPCTDNTVRIKYKSAPVVYVYSRI